MDFLLAQIFGGLALAFDVVKFTRKNRGPLILWGIPAGWSMIASQYFMGQDQGAAFQAMASIESLLQSLSGKDNRQHHWQRILIALFFGSLGFFIYAPTQDWWTWLPVGSYIFASLGKLFYQPWLIRIVWLCSSACTLAYSVIYGNWSIVIQQIVVVSLTIHFLWIYYRNITVIE